MILAARKAGQKDDKLETRLDILARHCLETKRERTGWSPKGLPNVRKTLGSIP